MEPIKIKYAAGEEPFIQSGSVSSIKLLDFWAWAYSDCINNTTRGILAEFLVAMALGIDLHKPRDAWAKFDLVYRDKGIEVKSASYHQRWHQEKMSNISFTIPATKAWEEETGFLDTEAKRQAFIYVLCLLSEKTRALVNPLDIDQWVFWVIPTRFFNERKRSQHSITYSSLIKEVGQPVTFAEIRPKVDYLIDTI
ncbi:MAG: hypothetical protein JSV82_09450 [Planctomycetota bacterium]|nr:MAG: hypothetical protein JSV82_09450 [Planctomycetota bacterium]